MTCKTDAFNCRIRNVYIASGNSYYHGEVCGGCPWWHDTPEDSDFKAHSLLLTLERNRKMIASGARTVSQV